MLFTVPSRYWCTIGRWRYLALGRGRPRFPPDVTCPAVLTIWAHSPAAAVAYGTLTPCGDPFQRSSAHGCWSLRGGCRPLQPTRSTPRWHRRQAVPPAGFGLLPVRSPLLRESSLFLGVLRCFSSPGALLACARCPAVRRAGCPIRTSPDRRLPAPPRGISPRGRVLRRPPTPRHPPCALHADSWFRFHPVCVGASASDRLAPEGRPLPARCPAATTIARRPERPGPTPPPNIPTTGGELGRCAGSSGVAVMCFCDVSMQCARAVRHKRLGSTQRSSLPRPQNPTGSAWRIVKVPMRLPSPLRGRPRRGRHTSSELPKTCVSRTSDEIAPLIGDRSIAPGAMLGMAHPGVEPRGFEPRTSAVQGRRSPG